LDAGLNVGGMLYLAADVAGCFVGADMYFALGLHDLGIGEVQGGGATAVETQHRRKLRRGGAVFKGVV
jgi:hypothetical protein